MSDITKKIFSIEPVADAVTNTGDEATRREPSASDIVQPIENRSNSKAITTKSPAVQAETVPDFVTRNEVRPQSAPPAPYIEDNSNISGWGLWFIIGFGVLYIVGAGLYFGMPMLENAPSLFAIAGLMTLLLLPLALLVVLSIALKRLNTLKQQSLKLAKSVDILVSPETEALTRTQTLAGGIRTEISKLNIQLASTVEVLQGVQTAVTRESQALDAAGVQLSGRSEDVGRNLTLQRQALESISGTFDAQMGSLSAQIAETSQGLEAVCVDAETRLSKAGASLTEATSATELNITKGTDKIGEEISKLGDVSRKLDTATDALTSDLGSSTKQLIEAEAKLTERGAALTTLNTDTQAKMSDLQATIGFGNLLLSEMQSAADARETELKNLYERLSSQFKQAEDDTLASQGKTARVVEANLAQMRRDFGRMETELQTLQSRLNGLRDSADAIPEPDLKPARLHLKPLDSDFPPVEPPVSVKLRGPSVVSTAIDEAPLNLGMDMEIETPDAGIMNFEPDVISRPGQPHTDPLVNSKKGFGRKNEKDHTSGWRWRDMLGGLERPDTIEPAELTPQNQRIDVPQIDIIERLNSLQLSPSAFVDEGTILDATQARINSGEAGLASVVSGLLPDAVAHLRGCIAADNVLAADVERFHADFSQSIGNTPPSAPALRAAFGSPDGRAYLLCSAALKG